MKRELEPYQMIERSIIKKYRKELWTPFIVAVKRYELIQAGDRIAVCISGGKDSMLMAKLMQELQKHSDVPFELVFLVMDPGYNELNRQKIESNAALLHIPVTIFESNIFSVANNTDKNPCYLCARMRRGHLYSKAKELGCKGTHFVNPHGLHDPDHYTTAYDIALMMQAAMEHELFQTIITSPNYVIPATNLSEERTVRNTNALTSNWTYTGYLYRRGTGGKTGSTDEAGKCLVETAKDGDTYLISVILGSGPVTDANGEERQGQFYETIRLLDWGFDNFRRVTISQGNDPVDKVAVTLSRQADEVMVKPEGEVVRTLPKDLDPSLIETTIHLNSDTVEAPVEEGQVLGTMTLSYEGTDYGSLDLVAVTSVERSELLYKKAQVVAFFQNFGVRVAAVIILILVIAVLLKVLVFRKERRYGARVMSRGRRNYRGGRR